MRVAKILLITTLFFSGCAGNPNSLRSFSEVDGSWVVAVSSADCAISETVVVNISGQAFGTRIPQTNIFLSGVVRDVVVRTELTQQQSLQGKGQPNTEISQIEVVFESGSSARGTWRSSRCSGVVTMNKRVS